MRRISSEEIDFLDDVTARLPGSAMTGQSVERDGGNLDVQTFVRGYALGPAFLLGEDGKLLEYSNCVGNLELGPSFAWYSNGGLRGERVVDFSSRVTILSRSWSKSGVLLSEEMTEGSEAWRQIPPHPGRPGLNGYIEVPAIRDLEFGDQVTHQGVPYSGEAISLGDDGGVELFTFAEGVEDGPFVKWSSGGKLIIQGLRQGLYGKIGPWHEWDEQGRLLREIIYDALGNKIIHRELDEGQNIVAQEHFGPTTLMADPETGERYPAPWL